MVGHSRSERKRDLVTRRGDTSASPAAALAKWTVGCSGQALSHDVSVIPQILDE